MLYGLVCEYFMCITQNCSLFYSSNLNKRLSFLTQIRFLTKINVIYSLNTFLNFFQQIYCLQITIICVGKMFYVQYLVVSWLFNLFQLYQNFIRLSPLPASHQLFDGGFWRNIIVRSNEAGDHLAIIITNPGNYTPEQISEQERLMKDYFSQHAPSLSLFHQSWLVETIFLCRTFFY